MRVPSKRQSPSCTCCQSDAGTRPIRRCRGNAGCTSFPEQKTIEGSLVVHCFSRPSRGRRARVDRDTPPLVVGDNLAPIRQRQAVLQSDTLEAFAVRLTKAQRTVVQHVNGDTALVHLPVVEPAETDQVGGLRLATVCPMMDVVCVHVARVWTSREAASAVAGVQSAA